MARAPTRAQALRALEVGEQSLARRIAHLPPEAQQRARRAYITDPRVQAARRAAGLPEVTARREEVQRTAQANIARENRARQQGPLPENPLQGFTDAFSSAVGNTFGIGPRIAALPRSLISGRSYGDELDIIREEERIRRGGSTAGNVLGTLYGGAGGGALAAGAVRAGGRALATVAPRVGQTVQNLTRLERGQRVRNVGKLVAGGAAGGAAQAAGEGEDVGTGAVVGAVAAPALVGTAKVAQRVLSLPWNAIGGSSAARGIIRQLTRTNSEELAARAAQRRQQTGAEPTVFELLDPADQKRILEDVVGPDANIGEEAARSIATRLQETGGIMASRTRQIVQPRRQQVEQEITGRIAAARGAPAPEDAAFAAQASRSPETMERLRSVEAGAIMAPFDNQIAVGSIDDLVPQVPVNNNGRISMQPDTEIAATLRSASGSLRLRGQGGITVGEITQIRRRLKSLVDRGDISSGPAAAALENIDNLMASQMPGAAAAIARMDEAFAGASRMAEGMKEGTATRLRDAPGRVGTSDVESRLIRNVYDTPEGSSGRVVGQANRLEEMFGGTTSESARALREVTGSGTTQRAIAENIGMQESADLVAAARELDDAVRSLSRALPKAEGAGTGADDLDTLVDAVVLGNPATFPTAKMWAFRRLVSGTSLPEARARDLVNMLFSRDPRQTRRALTLLNSRIEDATSFRRDLGLALSIGSSAAGANTGTEQVDVPPVPEMPAEPDYSQMSDEELMQAVQGEQSAEPDYSQMSDEELMQLINPPQASASPYAEQVQSLYQYEDPAFLDLLDRVEQQESRGNPNAVSSAGAAGVMQVMPGTGPEAARLAGVPWDAQAYRSDPAYQKLIGAAYLAEMLRQFDGDVAKALAAYNAGPGRVRKAVRENPRNWLVALPQETKDYVRILL